MTDTNRIDAIRKRRAALSSARWISVGTGVYHENLSGRPVADCREFGDTPVSRHITEFIAAAPADIDYLLEDNDRLSTENVGLLTYASDLSAEVERLRAENERLRVSYVEADEMMYAIDHFSNWGDTIPTWRKDMLRAADEYRRKRFNYDRTEQSLQQLTDISQELGLYEEADNPLVKDDDEREDG